MPGASMVTSRLYWSSVGTPKKPLDGNELKFEQVGKLRHTDGKILSGFQHAAASASVLTN